VSTRGVRIDSDLLFDVATPLGFAVRCARGRWEVVATIKHPALSGRQDEIRQALIDPVEVRQSQKDPDVLLFYRRAGARWLCAVVGRQGTSGYLITAYPTDAIKAGASIWTKSK
jgi:hypothetical protein